MTGPFTALNLAFVRIFNFSGRASRSEFWWVALFVGTFTIAAAVVDLLSVSALFAAGGPEALIGLGFFDFYSGLVSLIFIIPMTSLSVRRLHDAGFSGFWILASVVPIVGGLLLMVMYALPSRQTTSVHGSPAVMAAAAPRAAQGSQKNRQADAQKRAMQGYALLFDKDQPVTPEMEAARKAEISDYYRSRVLKPAASA
ncbi:DUF805 domain-containing protein [Sulfitobacter sp. HNIBRBA3233]|uniref:DUF805 domain-containing protein n=1 Tax=Sulfitobacter marinivivus TaxID=3158558 RepID=UPI0032DF0EE0